jgi:hypothetical protein
MIRWGGSSGNDAEVGDDNSDCDGEDNGKGCGNGGDTSASFRVDLGFGCCCINGGGSGGGDARPSFCVDTNFGFCCSWYISAISRSF